MKNIKIPLFVSLSRKNFSRDILLFFKYDANIEFQITNSELGIAFMSINDFVH